MGQPSVAPDSSIPGHAFMPYAYNPPPPPHAQVPGLFEGDEYTTLMTQCKEGSQREGLMLDSAEELYKWFTQEVMRNLHVVFTMNPSSEGLKDRAATSPALFNRCGAVVTCIYSRLSTMSLVKSVH